MTSAREKTCDQHVYDKSPEHYAVRCLVCGFDPNTEEPEWSKWARFAALLGWEHLNGGGPLSVENWRATLSMRAHEVRDRVLASCPHPPAPASEGQNGMPLSFLREVVADVNAQGETVWKPRPHEVGVAASKGVASPPSAQPAPASHASHAELIALADSHLEGWNNCRPEERSISMALIQSLRDALSAREGEGEL